MVAEPGRDEVRPLIVICYETESDLVVGQTLVMPDELTGACARVLSSACAAPSAGAPRTPARVWVESVEIAEELSSIKGLRAEVVVGEVPEIDGVMDSLRASLAGSGRASDEGPGYLQDGGLSRETVGALFEAARALYAVAPWKDCNECLARIDIPELDVAGACLVVIGALGDVFGFLLFPSADAHEQFIEATARTRRGGPDRFGTPFTSLTFVCAADLPSRHRREAMRERWPVASSEAYPLPERLDSDGLRRSLTERDMKVLGAVTSALCAFAVRHPRSLTDPDSAPVRETSSGRDNIAVRITVPYEAYELFEAKPTGAAGKRESKLKVEDRLLGRMLGFACETLGRSFVAEMESDFDDIESAVQLVLPFGLFHRLYGGRTVAARFFDAHGSELAGEEAKLFAAHREGWLSIWEVEQVQRGRGLELLDVLSGQRCTVVEKTLSRSVAEGHCLLACVLRMDGRFVINGMHGRPLAAPVAALVAERGRRRLRRKREVPVERLRDGRFARALLGYWEDAVATLDAALRPSGRG